MKLIVEIQDERVFVYRETEEHFARMEQKGRHATKISNKVIEDECDVFLNDELGENTYMVFDLAETQTDDTISKPVKKVVEYYDYKECAKYIANKFGVSDLRDFSGRYGEISDKPYQDFWHVVIDNNGGVSNGSYVIIHSDFDCPDWARPIVGSFVKEFGDGQKYWVKW